MRRDEKTQVRRKQPISRDERWRYQSDMRSQAAVNHLQDSHLSSISIPEISHPHRPRTNMDVFRFRNLMTYLNRLNPSMSHHLIYCWPICGIGFQHLANETTTCSGIEIIDCRRAWCYSLMWTGTGCDIGRIELVGCRLRCTPWKLLEVQAVVDYPACPDIYQPSVIGYHRRRNMGSRIFEGRKFNGCNIKK